MLVWFLVLAVTGLAALLKQSIGAGGDEPVVMRCCCWAAARACRSAILGGVFLAMTGGEALYADMGHFGKKPVRVAWFALVWPALVLNYFGQGALILGDPAAAHLPLYQLVPVARAAADGAAGDRGHDHRLAGHHHRRLLGHAPVHPARSAAAAAHHARPRRTSTARSTSRW